MREMVIKYPYAFDTIKNEKEAAKMNPIVYVLIIFSSILLFAAGLSVMARLQIKAYDKKYPEKK